MTATDMAGIGDLVHVWARSTSNNRRGGLVRSRVRQPGVFEIVRVNRHGDWTV